MQEFALLSVWPREDGVIAVQLRLRPHQAAAQHWAFLFDACKRDENPGSGAQDLGLSHALYPSPSLERNRGTGEVTRPGLQCGFLISNIYYFWLVPLNDILVLLKHGMSYHPPL